MLSGEFWMPEVMYEEGESIPFILVPEDKDMPLFLMIWEHKDTGKTEPGPMGEELPIVQPEMRQYARMDALKENLSAEDYDKVRLALGLKPMKEATKLGRAITARAKSAAQGPKQP